MKHTYLAVVATALFVLAGAAPSFADQGSATTMVSQTKAFAGAAASTTTGSQVAAMMNFGSPPSGEVPILFNDRHVYAKPDTLRQGRVLAALVKNGVLLVPLRSMFEQMGATVSYDGAAKSVKAMKPGSEVVVTLGRNEVLINGESRPLDVPPMMYKGSLLVPIRVISEALGAYVQWVPEQRVAVVRYVPPTPVPTPAATPAATPVPTPAPTETPKPELGYLQGGYTYGRNYNEYAAGVNGRGTSVVGSGALLFNPLAIKVDWRQDEYLTTANAASSSGAPLTQFNTIDGGMDFVPQFTARNSVLDGRLEFKIANPQIYIGGSYVQASNNYGNPRLTGAGGGLEKLPDFQSSFGWFGSAFYYPQIKGNYTVPFTSSPNFGKTFSVEYQLLKYDIGLYFGGSIYGFIGYSGDRYTVKQNAPIGQTHSGPYAGLGVHF